MGFIKWFQQFSKLRKAGNIHFRTCAKWISEDYLENKIILGFRLYHITFQQAYLNIVWRIQPFW